MKSTEGVILNTIIEDTYQFIGNCLIPLDPFLYCIVDSLPQIVNKNIRFIQLFCWSNPIITLFFVENCFFSIINVEKLLLCLFLIIVVFIIVIFDVNPMVFKSINFLNKLKQNISLFCFNISLESI